MPRGVTIKVNKKEQIKVSIYIEFIFPLNPHDVFAVIPFENDLDTVRRCDIISCFTDLLWHFKNTYNEI